MLVVLQFIINDLSSTYVALDCKLILLIFLIVDVVLMRILGECYHVTMNINELHSLITNLDSSCYS